MALNKDSAEQRKIPPNFSGIERVLKELVIVEIRLKQSFSRL